MLRLHVPDDLRPERDHAARLVFGALLNIEFDVVYESRRDIAVTVAESPTVSLRMPDIVFSRGEGGWPHSAPRPADVPPLLDLPALMEGAEPLPVLFGMPGPDGDWWACDGRVGRLGVDVLGTAFWIMSRMEELLDDERDTHERFAGARAHAVRAGYIHRPIVDETCALLGAALRTLWPGLNLPRRRYVVMPTHDVDRPFKHLFQTPQRLLRTMLADVARRRGMYQVLAAPRRWLRVRRGLNEADPFFMFDWLMDRSEERGLRSAFYFISGHSGGRLDGDYDVRHPRVRALLRRIHERGHEIGLHGSYQTFRAPHVLQSELSLLRRVCAEEQINQEIHGGRQHVLRFDARLTPAVWQEAGLAYDCTLGYADVSGFRCGTCQPFPLYDHEGKRTLQVVEHPLLCMDVTLLNREYQGLTAEEAHARITQLKAACQAVRGEFMLLWHNCHLDSTNLQATYLAALS